MAKKEETTTSVEVEEEVRRRPSVVTVLLIGALIGFAGLLLGAAGGYALGRFQTEARMNAQISQSERAFLGVGVLHIEEGALVHSLHSGGPAEEAGLMVGDIIVEFDGEMVDETSPLEALIFAHEPDDKVEVGVLRGGEREMLEVTLGSAPTDFGREPIPGRLGRIPGPDAPGFFFEPGLGRRDFATDSGPYLGVTVSGEDQGRGLLVDEVESESPAEEAGLQAGDIILTANGERIDTLEALRDQIEEVGVGGELTLEIRRDGEREELVAEIDAREVPAIPVSPRDFGPEVTSLGVFIQTMTREVAREVDVPYEPGVLIVTVEPDSPAQRVGLRERDIITAIDGESVRDAETLTEIIRDQEPGDVVALEIVREGDLLDFEVALGSRAGVPFSLDRELDTLIQPGFSGQGIPGEVFVSPPRCRVNDELAPCL